MIGEEPSVPAGIMFPAALRRERANSAEGTAWLDDLPGLVERACTRWRLTVVGPPYAGGSCAWVSPVHGADGSPAVLKITWPHPEAATEAAALRWWGGEGAIRLLAEDPDDWAMLLEPCRPGTPLRESDRAVGDRLAIGADLLAGLWSKGIPADDQQFVTLEASCRQLADHATARHAEFRSALDTYGVDHGLVAAGIDLLRTLPTSADRAVVLHGDFNPGNVLAAERAPFLAIDPKPLVGDPAYDPWPLISQLGWPPPHDGTMSRPPADSGRVIAERISRLADLVAVPADRIAAWGLARDVEAGLWRMSEGHLAGGADWITAAAVVGPLID